MALDEYEVVISVSINNDHGMYPIYEMATSAQAIEHNDYGMSSKGFDMENYAMYLRTDELMLDLLVCIDSYLI